MFHIVHFLVWQKCVLPFFGIILKPQNTLRFVQREKRKPILFSIPSLYFLCSVLLCSFCILLPYSALATHSVGFDLRYECMGGNLYRFTLNFYRDCEGLEAPI